MRMRIAVAAMTERRPPTCHPFSVFPLITAPPVENSTAVAMRSRRGRSGAGEPLRDFVTQGNDRIRETPIIMQPMGSAPGTYLSLHAVNIYVRDQERSVRFYVDQLGFDLAFDARLQSGERW